MNVQNALDALKEHIEGCDDGHYKIADDRDARDLMEELGVSARGHRLGNMVKYLVRYCNNRIDGIPSAGDLLKLAHETLIEYEHIRGEK